MISKALLLAINLSTMGHIMNKHLFGLLIDSIHDTIVSHSYAV